MKNNFFRLIVLAIFNALVLVGVIIFGVEFFFEKELNFWNFTALIFSLAIVILMIAFTIQNYKKMKNEMPLENERSERIIIHTASKSFYISICWLFAVGVFEKYLAKIFSTNYLTAAQTIGISIAGMAFIFLVAWAYYEKKGRIS